MRYLPSNPEWNKVTGESDGEGSPLLMATLGSALSLLLLTILVFTALGYSDISVKDGKLRVKRYGEVDDALEPAVPSASGPIPIDQILGPASGRGLPPGGDRPVR